MSLKLLSAVVFCLAGSADAQTATDLVGEAQAAYRAHDPAARVRLYGLAFEQGRGTPRTYYGAACCAALAGRPDTAFAYLHEAINTGFRDIEWLARDSDLDTLRSDPAWSGVMASAEAAHQAFLASLNLDLYEVYRADQADRRTRPIDWNAVTPRDSARRVLVAKMLASGEVVTADDYFHASMVFQHGQDSTSFKLAWELARESVRLDSTNAPARQMAAMAQDRYLWSIGEPQIWGSQSKMTADGFWTSEPYDPSQITDGERIRAGLITVEAGRVWLEQRNAAIRERQEAGQGNR